MRPKTAAGVLAFLMLSVTASRTGIAQEFRVYTRVSGDVGTADPSRSGNSRPILGRSLSIFHAGRVYDYLESVGEVIVFEPAQRQFMILNTSREIQTTVQFAELKHLLKMARLETEKYLAETAAQDTPPARQLAETPEAVGRSSRSKGPNPLRAEARTELPWSTLEFQLKPAFEEEYDAETKKLTLSSPYFRYEVECASARTVEAADDYLRWADWMARLNFVVSTRAFFPQPRLALNARLRRLQMLPVEVALEAQTSGGVQRSILRASALNSDRRRERNSHKPARREGPGGVHLRAEHQIHWELNEKDRSLIHRWQRMLESKHTKHVPFREYQRMILN